MFAQQDTTKLMDRTISDKDGNTYTIAILEDDRIWVSQNLNLKIKGSFCFENEESNCEKYGCLYTWKAANKACQALGDNWRLPTDAEWHNLANLYGGLLSESDDNGAAAFKALQEGGKSDFNATRGGFRDSFGAYFDLGDFGYYWTNTENTANPGYARSYLFRSDLRRTGVLQSDYEGLSKENSDKTWGFSCRCIQDQ